MGFETNNVVILTGAGFTKNFGGFLGYEMWNKIFNNQLIQSQSKLKELLQRDFDFESVYSIVGSSERFNSKEKNILKTVIEEAYCELENGIKRWVFNSDNPLSLNIYGLSKLLTINLTKEPVKNLFFTLNQDLFMERKFNYRSPGAARFAENFYDLEHKDFVQLLNLNDVNKIYQDIESSASVIYIKLHGSYGWLSHNPQNTAMIIGKNKIEDINNEPVLREYYNIFINTIKQGNKKLLVIGYGFNDEHINNIILEGIAKYNLSLCIVNNTSPEEFTRKIGVDSLIWKATKGYFPYTLKDIFPPNQEETQLFLDIKKVLLN